MGFVIIMPYSEKAKYKHFRQESPKHFKDEFFPGARTKYITQDLAKTKLYSGKKFDVKGARAIVGTLKEEYGGKRKIQSILIPKDIEIK